MITAPLKDGAIAPLEDGAIAPLDRKHNGAIAPGSYVLRVLLSFMVTLVYLQQLVSLQIPVFIFFVISTNLRIELAIVRRMVLRWFSLFIPPLVPIAIYRRGFAGLDQHYKIGTSTACTAFASEEFTVPKVLFGSRRLRGRMECVGPDL
ncbi:hypothetical protein BT96DRAFT_933496 [Gymnopus androsaceus JB14]|uniref:Uncharacterized protein n=1 Tax=Gymnopus androsaceus JB14 TaxID=1447944 RepID=A0A6A4IDC4_9AGAR|nr:hypothetical protein BT96DRAFT_933496 [Gymnopus androsaceus JB14]